MAQVQLPLPGEVVKKSNALARAKWPVDSEYELKLVALVASRVHKDDADLQTYTIPSAEILPKGVAGSQRKKLRKVCRSLMSRVLEIEEPGGGWVMYNVFTRCRYLPGGQIEVQFHEDLKPHYLGLKRFFTQYGLIEYLMIPGVYAKRLYEVLRSWDDKPEVTISISELRPMIGVEESTFSRWPDFRRKVLDKSKNNIEKHTSLRFEWEGIKQGRAYVAVRFIFSKARALEAQREKQHEQKRKAEAKQEAESKRRTELFMRAGKCFQDRGHSCDVEPTGEMCTVCVQTFRKGGNQ